MDSRSETRGRVLVTGADGFTGRYVAHALREAGFEPLNPTAGGLEFDLTAPASIEAVLDRARADYVIHLAAISFVAHTDASAFYRVNTVGTVNLLEALARSNCVPRKVVIASSANIYGNATVEPIDESTPPAPVNHYACSKLAMEHMARQWFDRLPIVMTRPFNYTGPRQGTQFLVPKIVDHFARRAASIELGNIDVVRDFSDVRMVADAYVRLLTGPVVSDVLNICSGTGRALRWVIDEMTRIAGYGIDVRVNPAFVRASEIARLVGNNARLVSATGQLQHIDFGATLRWMFDEACRSR